MRIKNLSVFFPLYNEEGNVLDRVEKATAVLENLRLDYEILLIDDGSADKTGQIADELANKNPKIRVIHHPKNLGYGEALKSGFYNARNEIIVYTDGDGQFDFAEVNKFLEKIEDHDLVIGYRIKRQDPFFRILFKKGWKLTLLAFFRLTLKDVDCGFKMVRKEVLEKIPHLQSSRGAMINAELAIKAKKKGFKISQVGVNHYPRLSGKPTGANINVISRSYLDLVSLWWRLKEDKIMFILLLGILTLALALRVYKLDQYMIFLGDEGRDAIIVKDMVEGRHFPLIGPPTSVGNIYLGPLYYYMMFPPMAIFNLSPIAAAAMVALIGVLTVWFIYYLGKVWFGKRAGILAAYFCAISPVTINYSRFSWNPNPLPFFALLTIFGLYKLHRGGNFLWLILTGLSLAAAAQMHYLALILIPIVGLIFGLEIYFRYTKKQKIQNLLKGTFLGFAAFLILMSPLILFDLRHDFLNYKAVTALFSQGQTFKIDSLGVLSKVPSIYSNNLIGRYLVGENSYLAILLSALIIVPFFLKLSWPKLTLGIWLIVSLVGLSFYQQDIYDHYLGFLNPVPFLLLGSLAVQIPASKIWKYSVNIGLVILVVVLSITNLQKNPLLYPPNNQLKNTQDIAKFIIQESGDRPFNFALLAKNNYDSAYQFYLELYGHKPKQVPFEKTNQLFVVCEDQICDPTHSPKYEIAAFGWSKIDWQKSSCGVKIYKLVPNPSGKP